MQNKLLPEGCEHRYLIINADDLGICPERDTGILELFERGAISSATLLVNGENAESAARQAVASGLPLGLHLNLTEGPSLPGNSLGNGQGHLRGKFGLRAALASHEIVSTDIAAAIRAQFDRFIALTGELPSHVDGHHHIHVEAQVAAILAPIMAREYGIYCVRLPCENTLLQPVTQLKTDEDFEADFQQQIAHTTANSAPIFAVESIYSTDAFLGQSLMGNRLQAEPVAAALATMQSADQRGLWVELMVHPGIPATASSGSHFCRLPARAHEMDILQSGVWQQAISGWKLASFRAMPRPIENNKPTILIYGKLTPATGNAETARRCANAWAGQANIRFRPLPAEACPPATEITRLCEMAKREQLNLAFGIHIFRAGTALAAAFASPEHASLAFGLLASGTDANADVAIPERRAVMADTLRKASFLLCLTPDLLRRLDGMPLPADTAVQPNGIEIRSHSVFSLRAALQLDSETTLIFFPASLRRLKGVLPTLKALATPLAKHWTRHVLIVLGPALEADYTAELQKCIAALTSQYPNLAGRLLLHAGLPHDDYLATLPEASLVLNASEHEGLSHALAEAMAAGIPILARDNAGNRELVRNGDNGRLFADFKALPEAYSACFETPQDTARMARLAQSEITRRYPLEAEQASLRAVLQRALTRSKTH